ncbi:FAD-binding protein [Streptomyces sp. NBC_01003]|uniref:D-arabinono-1,4-lactone oxidase n=1 Tax=Streptomyces sp. NBC_01003 TaxID=2903714 RepID=UPI003864158E|nr:FAD-binding protein [Streptomyces sp. NBC_01003]
MPATDTPLRNWAGNVTFGAARVHRPTSEDELCRTVASAEKVRVLGSGHSFNRIVDTDGDLVLLDGLARRVQVSEDRATVSVSAGMRYAEVASALQDRSLALANLASLPHISVAGSCATGTHGSGDSLRGLATAVTGIELIGPDGTRTTLDRASDPDRFPGAVVNLGALGVVVGMTLAVEPAFDVAQWVYDDVPLDRIAEDFDAVFGAAYSVSAFTDWRAETATVWLKRRTDRLPTGTPGGRWMGGLLADGPRHPVPGMPPSSCTEQLGVPGPWHERLPHFRPDFTPSNGEELQSELLLPREAAADAMAALRALGDRIAPVLLVSEIRTVAADDLWLSPSHGRASLALHFTWVRRPDDVLPVIGAIEERLLPLGARPHWGKLTTAAPRTVAALYERAPDFRRLRQELDPAGKFSNAFVTELFAGH